MIASQLHAQGEVLYHLHPWQYMWADLRKGVISRKTLYFDIFVATATQRYQEP